MNQHKKKRCGGSNGQSSVVTKAGTHRKLVNNGSTPQGAGGCQMPALAPIGGGVLLPTGSSRREDTWLVLNVTDGTISSHLPSLLVSFFLEWSLISKYCLWAVSQMDM